MGDGEPEINLDKRDPVGEIEANTLQTDGRVSIPERFYRHLGIEEGQRVLVICEENKIEIMEATKEHFVGG